MILDYIKKTSQTYIKCVDIEGFLIDYLKCTLIYENIAEPDDANKMAFKANGVKPLHIRDSSGKIKQVVYPANTIVLDKYFLAYERSAARRFTIGHECGHVVKERLYQTECCASYYRDASVASSIPSEEICEYFKMEETQASKELFGECSDEDKGYRGYCKYIRTITCERNNHIYTPNHNR